MHKRIAFLIYKIIYLFDSFLFFFSKRSFLVFLPELLQKNAYKEIKILGKNINFFIPNETTKWRVDTLFIKEPETLEWIDSFDNSSDFIFWDIGANIGLYSIYNSLKNRKSTTIAFEPSSSNLRVLTRNISINNLEKNIKVVSIPLTNKENIFQEMKEGQFVEGGALNSFGEKFDFEGKEFKPTMKYNLLGTTINYFLENSILDIPDYIKIDVDGIEHLILEGGDKFLNDKKVKSLSIEINENFKEQYDKVLNLMNKYEFKLLHKKHNDDMYSEQFKNTYNYIFKKLN